MDYEKYIASLMDKGYNKETIITKLSNKSGAPYEWVSWAYDICEQNDNKEWVDKLTTGQLEEEITVGH